MGNPFMEDSQDLLVLDTKDIVDICAARVCASRWSCRAVRARRVACCTRATSTASWPAVRASPTSRGSACTATTTRCSSWTCSDRRSTASGPASDRGRCRGTSHECRGSSRPEYLGEPGPPFLSHHFPSSSFPFPSLSVAL